MADDPPALAGIKTLPPVDYQPASDSHNTSSTDSGVGGAGSSSGEHTSGGECNSGGTGICRLAEEEELGVEQTAAEEDQQNGSQQPQLAADSSSIAESAGNFASSSSSMLSNVVGYARSRLFRHANDGLMPTVGAAAEKNLSNNLIVKQHPTPLGIQQQQQQSQSARGTPTKSPTTGYWKAAAKGGNNNKSCPVVRRQFGLAQQSHNGGGGSDALDTQSRDRDSLSIGSRESVISQSRSAAGLLDHPANPSLCSSRASWQQQNDGRSTTGGKEAAASNKEHWQLFAVTLHRASQGGFGIAISGAPSSSLSASSKASDQGGCGTGGGILISDVIPNGPAFGLLQVGDRITSCNGYPLEHAEYGSAVAVMKESQQLNMIVKRRVPVPFVEFEQRTLKFTLSKSRKKDDFGIVLGCRFYIKEILNPKLAEKEPGLKEGDTVLRINGQSLDTVTLEEASRLLQRSREKLSLVVQRDVRRGGGGGGGGTNGSSRWPSQTTVYERLGSLQATPRQSPTPAHYGFAPQPISLAAVGMDGQQQQQYAAAFGRKGSAGTEYSSSMGSGQKRFSDPMTGSVRVDYCAANVSAQNAGAILGGGSPYASHQQQQQMLHHYQAQQQQPTMMQMHNNGRPMLAAENAAAAATTVAVSCVPVNQQHLCSSPYLHGQQRLAVYPAAAGALQTRAQSQTPSSVQSLPVGGQSSHQQQQPQPSTPSNFYGPAAPPDYEQRMLVGQQQQQQRFAQQPQAAAAQRPVRMVNFQKGPAGLGIRVIGGNQVGIFVSAVQEQSPADQNGIRVGDRIHGVNGVSIAGLTREEAFDVLLSLGDQPISLALEHCPEDFAQVKAGKFGDSFYIRTHFAYSRAPPASSNGTRGGQQPQQQQQPTELCFQPGDIFHVTDTLFGGSPGFWQVTKVYSAIDAEQKGTGTGGAGAAGQPEPNTGIIPHPRAAEQLMRQQRQAAAEKSTNGCNGNGTDQSGGGGTLSRSLFRKKLSFSSRKLFGGGGGNTNANNSASSEPMEELLMSGGGNGNYATSELAPPAYERVALKRPAFHRPVVLFGPLADVARQLLLTQSGLRFGAPLPSAGPSASGLAASASSEMAGSTTSSSAERGIRLAAVDSVMAAQRHCVLCVSPGSVERLQLAQYAPIVVLIDVDSRARVRELRTKAGANTQSARKLLEQATRIKKQHSHLLTATLDASKEDQWFEALRALIFHLQERRVWMPEFQPDQALDDLLLFPLQPPGETPTSDGDRSDYGSYEPCQPQINQNNNNNTLYSRQQPQQHPQQNQPPPQQQQSMMEQSNGSRASGSNGRSPFMVANPAYSLAPRGQQQQQPLAYNNSSFMGSQNYSQQQQQPSSQQQQLPARLAQQQQQQPHSLMATEAAPSVLLSTGNSARNSPFPGGQQQPQSLSLYASASPSREAANKSQLLAQLASELGSPKVQQ